MKNQTIQKFEYDTLHVDKDYFADRHYDSLCKFNEKNDLKYFSIGRNKITFKQYVGLIQVGNLTIEILPKADRNDKGDDKNKWHKALIQMLRIAGEIDLKEYNNADLKLHHGSLFDTYISLFLSEFESLIHNGLQKKYRVIQENTKIFKGKLLLNNHIKENMIHKERFFNEFDTFDYDNKLNQILFCALNILNNFNLHPEFKNRIASIKMKIPEITLKKITEKDFLNLSYTRSFKSYEYAIRLAKLIILNYNPGVQSGSENVMVFLFDMNVLFEKFVYKLLKKYSNNNYEVKYQQEQYFWRNQKLRPDLILYYKEDDQKKMKVIDTKWKLPDKDLPSDADLRQMYAYNRYFKSTEAVLLYPSGKEKTLEVNGNYCDDNASPNGNDMKCKMRSFCLEFGSDNRLMLEETAIINQGILGLKKYSK